MCFKIYSGDLEEKSVRRSIEKWTGTNYVFYACLLPKFLRGTSSWRGKGEACILGLAWSVLSLLTDAVPEILRNDKDQFVQKVYVPLLCGYFR